MKIYLATYTRGIGGYTIDAVGTTRESAVDLMRKAVQAAARRWGVDHQDFSIDDEDIDVAELVIGKAYYDLGKAGEVKA